MICLASGANATTIPNGVVGVVTVTILNTATINVVNAMGSSAAGTGVPISGQAGVVTFPLAPSAPVVSATPGNGQVTLSWNAVSGATGYNVKQSTVSGGPYSTIASNVSGTQFVSSGLTNGVTYYYVASTMSGIIESANSSQVSAKPTAPAGNPTGTAVFVTTDTSTKGSWKGVYGADGYNVVSDSTSYPSYVTVTPGGNQTYSWGSTSDTRGLQRVSSSTDRIAAVWYSGSTFTVDLSFNDTAVHKVALYCVDWDSNNRAQTVAVEDANGISLDSRAISGFNGGQYLVWNLTGRVRLVFTRTGAGNAVMSGLFFDTSGSGGTTSGSGGSGSDSATFLTVDTSTRGNWKGVYGAQGYNIVNDSTSYPSYVSVTPGGGQGYTWGSTSDPRGLLRPGANTDRIAAVWYSGASFTLDLTFNDGAVHKVALYCVDWDSTSRAQTVAVQDSGGATLDIRSVSNFNGGQYLVWNLSGHVRLVFTRTGGVNTVMSGLFFDAASGSGSGSGSGGPVSDSVTFLTTDTTSRGNWKGTFGAQGYNVVNDAASYPSYVTVTPSGSQSYTWGSTSDTRGLLRAASSTDRIAAVWYSNTGFTIDFAFNDGAVHKVAIYCVDWDTTGRAQTVTAQDSNGTTLDVRTVSGFSGGQYLVWNMSGHVRLVFTRTGGVNAVVSGLFFDAASGGSGGSGSSAPPPAPATFLATDTTTRGNWKGVFGSRGYNVVNDAVSYPSYVTVTPSGNQSYTWGSTSDSRGLLRVASSTDRIASAWFSNTSFTIDLSFNDGAAHKVALYCVDWDTTSRAQTVTVQDGNGTTLDVQTVTGFNGGRYLIWNLSGNIRLVINKTGGANALINGLFFD